MVNSPKKNTIEGGEGSFEAIALKGLLFVSAMFITKQRDCIATCYMSLPNDHINDTMCSA